MANKIYPKCKKQLLQAGINLASVNVKVVAIDLAGYTYSDAHEFLSDIPSGDRIALSGNLASKTFSDLGAFDSADPAFTAVSGDPFEALALFVDTGSAATSRLIYFMDTGVTGLPATPDGGNFNILVHANGWFTL